MILSLTGTEHIGYTIIDNRRYDYFWNKHNCEILEESATSIMCVGYEPTISDAKRWFAEEVERFNMRHG